jgi:hypothetical protein
VPEAARLRSRRPFPLDDIAENCEKKREMREVFLILPDHRERFARCWRIRRDAGREPQPL